MGLIANVMDPNKQKPIDPAVVDGTKYTEASSVTAQPMTRTVDPQKETVSGQVDNLIKQDNPIMQRARAGAMQTANSRGLINSTMAAQAGEAAVLDAATPIATADANTYTTAARDNQAAGNTAVQAGADAANRSALQSSVNANEVSMQQLKGTQATGLANIEANYRQLIQANDSASRMFVNAQSLIASLQADPNTTTEQKQAAVNSVSQMLQSGLTVIGATANIDLGGLLDFSAAPGSPAPAQAPAAAQTASTQQGGVLPPRLQQTVDQLQAALA